MGYLWLAPSGQQRQEKVARQQLEEGVNAYKQRDTFKALSALQKAMDLTKDGLNDTIYFEAAVYNALLYLNAGLLKEARQRMKPLEYIEVKNSFASLFYLRAVAKTIKDIPEIKKVRYPGLPDDPFYDIARKQFGDTSGAMLTIDLESKEACFRFINNLKLIRRATNLFDNRTLAIHPASTIFGNFNERQREKMDVLDTTIRLSIGLEAPEDLIEDISMGISD